MTTVNPMSDLIPPSNEATKDQHVRVVAFYLPQFYPTPENDAWWGRGFTEWTNVTAARPLYRGHRQPQLPSDLGFYDLRVPEVRSAQAMLARLYGVTAFCYWHYWFAGRRMLERPFNEVLRMGEPDFPFCLGWANQSWTGVWHGAANRVLIEQTYPGKVDDAEHFDWLRVAFEDKRYLRVDNKPVFYIFRPEELPNPSEWAARWQEMAIDSGLEGLYLVAEVSDYFGAGPRYTRYRADGFDSGVYLHLPIRNSRSASFEMRIRRKLRGGPDVYPHAEGLPTPPPWLDEVLHPCVFPNWDNTPRSTRGGMVIRGTDPSRFREHIRMGIERARTHRPHERLLFLKSWNEWAEGNYLEPDREFGHGYLEALREGLGLDPLQGVGQSTAVNLQGDRQSPSVERAPGH